MSSTRDDPATDTSTVARGASWGLIGKITGRGLHTMTQVVLARSLGPAAYGLYAIGWTLFRLGALLVPLGLDRAILRFLGTNTVSDRATLKGYAVDAVGLALLSAVVVAALVAVSADGLALRIYGEPDLAPVLQLFAPALVCATVLRSMISLTWSAKRVRFGVITEDLGQPATNLLIVCGSTLAGWGLLGAVGAVLASFAIAALGAVFFASKLFHWVLDPAVRTHHSPSKLLRFSIPAVMASSLPVILTWTDRLVIGAVRPPQDMGVYQAISQLPIVFSLILSGIGGSVLGPLMADLHERGETARLNETFVVATKWGVYASCPVLLSLLFFHREAILLLFGPEYVGGATALVILAVAGFANAVSGPVGLLLVMTGHERRWLGISVSALLLDLALQSQLTPRLGLVGAALATLASLTFLFGLGLIHARRLGYWPYDRRYWKGTVATVSSLIMAAVCRVLLDDLPPPLIVILGSLVVVGSFVIVLFWLGLEEEDKAISRSLIDRRGTPLTDRPERT